MNVTNVRPDVALEDRLRQFFARETSGALSVECVAQMADSHAGYVYGVDLRDQSGRTSCYILKLAPVGVRRSGSTDIFRQVALFAALRKGGLPVPEIRWSSPRDDELGAPFIVMSRLAGKSYIIWAPHRTFLKEPAALPSLWMEGARALAQIHAFDSQRLLANWEAPTSLSAELDRWSALLRHSEQASWHALLCKLAVALSSSMPSDVTVGLIHGDFQPGNILYSNGAVSGIIDWDLAAIGPQAMDVGWYLMMADAEAWDVSWRPVGVGSGKDIVTAYAAAGGRAVDDLNWHQAFAHFRLGAITGLNLKLHLSGRRIDEVWERFAGSMPRLLRKALELLGQRWLA